MKEIMEEKGHEVIYKGIVPDDLAKIKDEVVQLLECDTDFIVATGGTGLTKDDVTIEVVAPLIEKEMPGFGEILRLRSYERIGSAAILTRALAGKIGDKAIFCLPGSPGAVELALREIIVPEIAHIMRHIRE
jgi:molybdenum cofactor biosynthesis protein B